MGGCAPYFYLIGMFKSSTKAISLGLVLGPKMYLLPLLSSLLSICSCTWLLLAAMALVWIADITAYFAGRAFGKHKLAPSISPGKTWEGAAASLVAAIAMAWVVIEWCGAGRAGRPCGGWLAYGLLVGTAGMAGDLAESLVKRDLGAKDSGRSLGGMGGFLDLVDSLLLAGPVAWLLWALA